MALRLSRRSHEVGMRGEQDDGGAAVAEVDYRAVGCGTGGVGSPGGGGELGAGCLVLGWGRRSVLTLVVEREEGRMSQVRSARGPRVRRKGRESIMAVLDSESSSTFPKAREDGEGVAWN